MPDENDLSGFEEQFEGVEDPSPWKLDSQMDDAQAVAIGRSLGAAILAVMPDIIHQLNEGRHPQMQYFYGATGCVIECDAISERHIHFCIQMPVTGPAFYHQAPTDG